MKIVLSLCLLILQTLSFLGQQTDRPTNVADFDDYLKEVLSYDFDENVIVDSTANYRFIFKTSLPLHFQGDLDYKHFADSAFLICTANPEVPKTSSFQLDYLITSSSKVDQVHLISTKSKAITCTTFEKSTPYTNIQFGDPIIFKADYAHFFSFESGRYVILCERRFGPDIRGSMPPGVSLTYFLERTD